MEVFSFSFRFVLSSVLTVGRIVFDFDAFADVDHEYPLITGIILRYSCFTCFFMGTGHASSPWDGVRFGFRGAIFCSFLTEFCASPSCGVSVLSVQPVVSECDFPLFSGSANLALGGFLYFYGKPARALSIVVFFLFSFQPLVHRFSSVPIGNVIRL